MVAPVELVRSVLTEDWSDDYAASEHWSKYWNAVSAPSDDEWPEGWGQAVPQGQAAGAREPSGGAH